MQKTATKIFIITSVAFGVIGVLFVLSLPLRDDNTMSNLSLWLQKLLFICVFIILPAFALSVAGKYLKSK
jgi:Na+/H+ antiporter NhaA